MMKGPGKGKKGRVPSVPTGHPDQLTSDHVGLCLWYMGRLKQRDACQGEWPQGFGMLLGVKRQTKPGSFSFQDVLRVF